MGKEIAFTTEIKLSGDLAKDFLQKKGVSEIEPDSEGNVVIGVFGEKQEADTLLGNIQIGYGLVEETNNREVSIFSDRLRKKGNKQERKVSVNGEGFGKQQLTNGVDILVQTNAPETVFKINRR